MEEVKLNLQKENKYLSQEASNIMIHIKDIEKLLTNIANKETFDYLNERIIKQNYKRIDLEKKIINNENHIKGIDANLHTYQNIFLDVPFYRQEKSLSCEISTLRMALNYYNFGLEEYTLEEQLPFVDPFYFDHTNNIWGDPQKGFVGSITASQSRKTGYGVLWKPIAKMAQTYMPNSYYFENGTLDLIVKELYDRHPIIVWSVYGLKGVTRDISWNTPEGEYIKAYNGEHTFVIIGFTGSLANPEHFIVVNPLSQVKKVSVKDFTDRWGLFNYSGVVVK